MLDVQVRVLSGERVRKHRAPKGALRPVHIVVGFTDRIESESTERQKVH